MFKILFLIFFVCLCAAVSHAQVRNLEDTLSTISPEFYKIQNAERNNRQKSDSLYFTTYHQKRLEFTQKNSTQLIADTTKQAAMLQLEYDNYKRSFKLPVQAFKTNAISLYTEGFTTIGKAKIMGKFYFDKTWDDSLANNLSGNLQNGEPFTHFATKAGNYERQNLNFEAGISYPVFKKLYLTSLVNYNYHWSTGSMDPRPENNIFHIKYTPGLSYKYKKTTVGVDYRIGKKDGDYDIKYKNNEFSSSQLYPDRFLYINNGYGYIGKYTSEAYNQSKDKIDGWGLNMATQLANWYINANYSNTFYERKNFKLITNTDNVDNPIAQDVHSQYELLTQKLDALIYNDNSKRVHQISFKGIINEGTGLLMSSPTGANYLLDEHFGFFEYLFSIKKDKKVTTELGLDANVNHFTKKDFLAQHFYENTAGYFSFYGGKYIYRNAHSFKISVKPGIILPLLNTLSVPETQKNTFTQNIVYPEYDFRGSMFFNGQVKLVYYTPSLLGIAGSAFSVNLNYLEKLKNSDLDKELYQLSKSQNNQLHVSLGFQIFL